MPYPTTTDYTLIEGLDPTSVFTVDQATALLSFLRLALPNAYRGFVIISTTTPATTGEPSGYPTDWYAWQKRCLWINPDTGEAFVYVTGLGWQSIAVVDGTITTAKLADNAVTTAKIAPGGSLKILRSNLANLTTEWVDFSTLVVAESIAPTKLIPVSPLSPTGYYFIQSTPSGGISGWVILDHTLLQNALMNGDQGTLDPNVLEGGNVGDVVGRFATDDVDFHPLTDFYQDNSILVAKLAITGGTALQQQRVNAGGTAMEFFTPTPTPVSPNIVRFQSAATALPGAGSATSLPHGLAGAPSLCNVWLVNVTPEAGYVAGDKVPYVSVTTDDGSGDNDYDQLLSVAVDATNVTLIRDSRNSNVSIKNKGTGVVATFTPASWTFQVEAIRMY